MKKFLVAMLAGIPMIASAQLLLGVKVMPQTTWMFNQQDSDAGPEFDYNTTFSFAVGGEAGLAFSENVGVGIELLYSSEGQKFDTFDVNFAKKLNYLKIPVLLNLWAPAWHQTSFLAQVGPQASLLLSSALKDANGNSITDPVAYSTAAFGVVLFLGASIATEAGAIVAGLRLDYGLTDAEDKSSFTAPAGRSAVNTATGGIVLGFRL